MVGENEHHGYLSPPASCLRRAGPAFARYSEALKFQRTRPSPAMCR